MISAWVWLLMLLLVVIGIALLVGTFRTQADLAYGPPKHMSRLSPKHLIPRRFR